MGTPGTEEERVAVQCHGHFARWFEQVWVLVRPLQAAPAGPCCGTVSPWSGALDGCLGQFVTSTVRVRVVAGALMGPGQVAVMRVVPVRMGVRTNRVSPVRVVDWPSTRAEGPLTLVIRNDVTYPGFEFGVRSRTGSRAPMRSFTVQLVKGSAVVPAMGQVAEAGGAGCPGPAGVGEAVPTAAGV
jgi:hypothetical protein